MALNAATSKEDALVTFLRIEIVFLSSEFYIRRRGAKLRWSTALLHLLLVESTPDQYQGTNNQTRTCIMPCVGTRKLIPWDSLLQKVDRLTQSVDYFKPSSR
ncbi:hypothetical protein O181_035213 [Austropuccinia psidii MF-1]|uniref:Uncharacterized protein n=1 Tax=Austropuccinia psidii MF-1 TaxID=1389203 RepID=A0A9Q3D510_9BASI|nr:hypothetical protein [Austropuccinia psidii MF-1]